MVTISFIVAGVIAGYGLLNLTVENRFIDYFKSDTEIYQGMLQIDEKLGGTTPLDIILDAPASFFVQQQKIAEQVEAQSLVVDQEVNDFEDDFEDDFLDDFEDDFGSSPAQNNLTVSSYWFNEQGLAKIKAIQTSLEALPETGKVLSLATSMSVFDNLRDAKPMDNFDLAFMHSVLSQDNKDTLFSPYMSCLLYTSPSPRDRTRSRMPSSA